MFETTNQYINVYRVGGFNPSEKYIKIWKSVGIIIPKIKIMFQTTNQPTTDRIFSIQIYREFYP